LAALAVALATLGAWPLAGRILDFLLAPVLKFLPPGESLKFFGLADAFTLNLKISLWAGLLASSPVTLYQLWAFLAPGLLPAEKKKVPFLAGFALFLLLLGVSFAYFLVWPIAFRFFLGFSSPHIQPLLAGPQYLSLAMGLVLVFALAFQLPLALMFLGKLGLIDAKTLKKYRPYAIVGFFVVGAILTPPDAVSQCFLAVTLCLLYELSLVLLPKPVASEGYEPESPPAGEAGRAAEAAADPMGLGAEPAAAQASPGPASFPADGQPSPPGEGSDPQEPEALEALGALNPAAEAQAKGQSGSPKDPDWPGLKPA
jgi:sec-independent protein translocase protein TatC